MEPQGASHGGESLPVWLNPSRTRQGRPSTFREVAIVRTRVQRRRPSVFGRTSHTVRHKTHARSVSDRPACADRVARITLEPRA